MLARLGEVRTGEAPGTVSGTLVLTAPALFGRLKVAPALESFLDAHPAVRARALLLDRMVDMTAEGVDVAIRLAHLHDTTLVAVGLGAVQQLVCGSRDYLARHGQPHSPADLSGHSCIGTGANADRELWTFRRRDGAARPRSLQVETRLSITSVAAGIDAALRGRGLMRVLSYQVAECLADGRLQRVLAAFEPEATPVTMIFRPNPRRWSPVRAFVDHAAPILRRDLARIAASIGSPPEA